MEMPSYWPLFVNNYLFLLIVVGKTFVEWKVFFWKSKRKNENIYRFYQFIIIYVLIANK